MITWKKLATLVHLELYGADSYFFAEEDVEIILRAFKRLTNAHDTAENDLEIINGFNELDPDEPPVILRTKKASVEELIKIHPPKDQPAETWEDCENHADSV